MKKAILVAVVALGALPLSACWVPYHDRDNEAYDHHADHEVCDYDRTGGHGDCRAYNDNYVHDHQYDNTDYGHGNRDDDDR